MLIVKEFFDYLIRKYELCYRIETIDVLPSDENDGYEITAVKVCYKDDFYIFYFHRLEKTDYLHIWFFKDCDLKQFNDIVEFNSNSVYINLIKVEMYLSGLDYKALYKDVCDKYQNDEIYPLLQYYSLLNFDELNENKDLILAPIHYVYLNIEYYNNIKPLIKQNNPKLYTL